MAAYYTDPEANFLRRQAKSRGDDIDLVACSDGVLRTAEDGQRFEIDRAHADSVQALPRPQ